MDLLSNSIDFLFNSIDFSIQFYQFSIAFAKERRNESPYLQKNDFWIIFTRHCAPVTVPCKNDPNVIFLKARWPTMPKPLPIEPDADPNGSPDRVPKSTISGRRVIGNSI